MKIILPAAILFAVAATSGAPHAAPAAQQPDWAYAIPPAGAPVVAPPKPGDPKLYSLPGTDKQFTYDQIMGRAGPDGGIQTGPADWFPNEHPAMPKIVAEGDQSRGIRPCSLCHYPNGKGRSENGSPQGLPREYIVNQLHDMKAGQRASFEKRKANAAMMAGYAKAMTEDEIQASAAYFSSMPWTPWIKVVEADTVPKTRNAGGLFITLEGNEAGKEPLGDRILETPLNGEHTEIIRDPHSGFIAYVPKGALAKGRKLVTTGGGKTTPCAVCHGQDLNGIAFVPPIAARSPSYIVRQLYDIQQGARHGGWTPLMNPVVAKLTAEDMIDIAAYTASLPAPAKE